MRVPIQKDVERKIYKTKQTAIVITKIFLKLIFLSEKNISI